MSDILWVAELGSMHKGDKSLAYEMIRQAAQAGATIAKFQFGWTRETQEALGLTYNPIRYVDEWAGDLAKWCRDFNIELMASLWSKDGLEVAQQVDMKRYKIAAQKAGNYALCDAIYGDGKETFVSLDRHSSDANYHTHQVNARLIWCKSKYPTYPADIAKTSGYPGMPDFPNPWGGYSDHMHGIDTCLLAVARGARYIEKHFCLDKSDLTVRDTPFSATPAEFAEMVRLGNGMRRLLDASV